MSHSSPGPSPGFPQPNDENQSSHEDTDAIAPQFPDFPGPDDLTDTTDEIDRDTEAMGWNQLSELGNHAISQGLIIGHGFYKGQYEILRAGESLVMSPDEALTYLQRLTRERD